MNRSLGIAFSANKIYFTELLGDKTNPRVDHIESVTVDFDFEDEFSKHKSNQKDLTNISSEIATYISRRNLNSNKAALSIGTSQAFMITLPIDFSEGKQSINSKIYWELSNYFPDNYNDFVINTYRLEKVLPCKNSDDYLVIAVQKNTIEFIKRIFKICNLELSLVDIDHFSAEHSFRNSYSDRMFGKNILFAGLKDGRVDYGYIENKKYKFYCHSKYSSDNEFNLNLTRKISYLNKKQPDINGIDFIFLYGDDIKEDTLDALRKMDIAPVEIINPFENINATDLFLKNSELRKYSYKFSASCGAALRNLNNI